VCKVVIRTRTERFFTVCGYIAAPPRAGEPFDCTSSEHHSFLFSLVVNDFKITACNELVFEVSRKFNPENAPPDWYLLLELKGIE